MTQIVDTSAVDFMARSEISKLLQEAFLTAYVITRSEFVAEQLVCLAIERLRPSQLQSSALVAETLKLSAEFTKGEQNQGRLGVARLDLGDELAALMELESAMRYSYVARVLLGYCLAECVLLLQTDAVTITRKLMAAMRHICERRREHRSAYQLAAFVSVVSAGSNCSQVACAMSNTH